MVTTRLDTVIKLHANPAFHRRAQMAKLGRRLRDQGLPAKRPSFAARLAAAAIGMEWDGQARESHNTKPYRDSATELRHRLGENLPTSSNGSKERGDMGRTD